MKFVIIDAWGDSQIVEADDIYEAIGKQDNAHYGYTHIISISKLPEGEDNS